MTLSNIPPVNFPSPDLPLRVLTDANFDLVNTGPTQVCSLDVVDNALYQLTVEVWAAVGADKVYRKVRGYIIGNDVAGNINELVTEKTSGAGSLTWNINAPSAGPGVVPVTIQVTGADSPRPTRVRVTLEAAFLDPSP